VTLNSFGDGQYTINRWIRVGRGSLRAPPVMFKSWETVTETVVRQAPVSPWHMSTSHWLCLTNDSGKSRRELELGRRLVLAHAVVTLNVDSGDVFG
jgi:hypothetical protein